jgi:hypothetical protein
VIGVSGLVIFGSLALLLYGATVGIAAMSVTAAWRRIENPPIRCVAEVTSLLVLLAGIPLVLLLTRQARDEFTDA